MGVGTVAPLYAAVQRWSGPAAGLVAGALLALTPVAALMFRFNNPDALLVLLMTLAGYFVVRAIETRARPDGAALAAVRRRRDRLRLPDQDDAGPAGAAGVRAGLPGRRPVRAVDQDLAPAGRRRRGGRVGRLVRRAGRAVAGGLPAVHRRQPRPTRCGSWPSATTAWAGSSAAPATVAAAVAWRRGRRSAAATPASAAPPGWAGCSAPRSAREISWLMPAALIGLVAGLWFTRRLPADRQDPGRAAALGRLAGRHRAGVLLHGGHHPPVLRGRAGPVDRRRWWRSPGASCGGAGSNIVVRVGAGADDRGDRDLVVRAARPGRDAGCRGCAGWC